MRFAYKYSDTDLTHFPQIDHLKLPTFDLRLLLH